MSGEVVWEMSWEQGEAYKELAQQLECREISEEEFAEQLTYMEGYPLRRQLLSGESLQILVKPQPLRVFVPGRVH